jgi:hypothetical protein
MTSWLRRLLLLPAVIGLAPVLIIGRPHPGEEVTWLVPLACTPFPGLLADRWPTQSSLLTIGAFVVALGLAWMIVRAFGLHKGQGSVWVVAGLSLVGPTLLGASLVLMATASGFLSLIWSGAADVAWGVFLLYLTRRMAAPSSAARWALRYWLAVVVLLGGGGFVFGVGVGLCC